MPANENLYTLESLPLLNPFYYLSPFPFPLLNFLPSHLIHLALLFSPYFNFTLLPLFFSPVLLPLSRSLHTSVNST